MPLETIYLDLNEDPPFVSAFMYIAVVTYPNNLKKRTDFVNACRAWIIKEYEGRLSRKKVYKQEILDYSETRKIAREFERCVRILNGQRLLANNIVGQSIISNMGGLNVVTKAGKSFSINSYLEQEFDPNYGAYKKDDAYQRKWNVSKAVVHLSLVLRGVLERQVLDHRNLEGLLRNPMWVKEAVIKAESLRLMLLEIRNKIKIRISDEQMISLRPQK